MAEPLLKIGAAVSAYFIYDMLNDDVGFIRF
jgi:hypothetical protein